MIYKYLLKGFFTTLMWKNIYPLFFPSNTPAFKLKHKSPPADLSVSNKAQATPYIVREGHFAGDIMKRYHSLNVKLLSAPSVLPPHA